MQRLHDLDLHEKKEVPKHRTEEKIKISDWANTGAICPKVLTMFCPMFWQQISMDLFTLMRLLLLQRRSRVGEGVPLGARGSLRVNGFEALNFEDIGGF